ncbi:hypothetical protein KIW84_023913 [Lathyrus oleraceus]|uniref:OTU domain-containing protein n=1 Tax=Pisum sativum TaxID=3888 RepID=A0A9D5B8N5_PEA|nr:hypothetical protein KIW84_023913 [Pisum sativum]
MLRLCGPEPEGSSADSIEDYTQFFTTDVIFQSRYEVLAWAQSIGEEHDVDNDGNCGFYAIAAQLGWGRGVMVFGPDALRYSILSRS